jgi:hypothetical protein
MNIPELINQAVKDLDGILRAHSCAMPDPEAVAAIQLVMGRMKVADHRAWSAVYTLATFADDFYSERKHLAIGADNLWAKMQQQLHVLRSAADPLRHM